MPRRGKGVRAGCLLSFCSFSTEPSGSMWGWGELRVWVNWVLMLHTGG